MDLLPADIFPFDEELECDYKGEHYSVRDNGAIMRHAKGRKRPLDEVWTFGEKDVANGYMVFRNERVHRIVATAFIGSAPSPQHVVDHIDTNRSNNRPENLRWLTKLENILLNENTLAKVIYICGSLDAFLENPELLFGHESEDANFSWMRTVTSEEAKATRENLKRLASRPQDIESRGAHVGDWIFKMHKEEWQPDFTNRNRPNEPSSLPEKKIEPQTVKDLKFTGGYFGENWDLNKKWCDSETMLTEEHKESDSEEQPTLECYETSNPLAVQNGWAPHTNPEFPCCPTNISEQPLQDYYKNLAEGKPFVVANYGPSHVYKFTIYEDILLVVTKIPNGVKSFGFAKIYWNGEVFVHKSEGTYFDENGVMAEYTIAQDQEWTGGDSIDFYC